MVLKLIREIKKKPVCQLGKGTRLLVPRHQNSGAWTPELWCPYLIFVAVLSMHIYSCWQCLKKKKNCFCKHFAYAKPCYCAPISTWMNYLYGNCPNAIYVLIEVLVDKGSTRAVVESSRIILLASTTPARYWGLLVISAPTKLPLLGRHISGAWTPDD